MTEMIFFSLGWFGCLGLFLLATWLDNLFENWKQRQKNVIKEQ